MESEERPRKLRKLSYTSDDNEHLLSSLQTVEHDSAPLAARKTEEGAASETTSAAVKNSDASPAAEERVVVSTEQLGSVQSLSKNQLKKLRKKEAWEAGRDYRKAKRKEKTKEKKAKKRAEREELAQARKVDKEVQMPPKPRIPRPRRPTRLPVTVVIDCGFDDLMVDKERISLGSQLTRSYSDVHRASYQPHLYVSSWSGLLKERFDTILRGNYRNWKDIAFTKQDFEGAAEQARQAMRDKHGGKLVAAFEKYSTEYIQSTKVNDPKTEVVVSADSKRELSEAQASKPETHLANGSNNSTDDGLVDGAKGDIIYLTSESPHTLESLHPHHIYVVGGLVDKNRHKGICYKTACDRNVRTAKLPIGEYLEMTSRFVLATNHVVEIMIKWLEHGDWAKAFMEVVPKRKGGRLKSAENGEEDLQNGAHQDTEYQGKPEASDDEVALSEAGIVTDDGGDYSLADEEEAGNGS